LGSALRKKNVKESVSLGKKNTKKKSLAKMNESGRKEDKGYLLLDTPNFCGQIRELGRGKAYHESDYRGKGVC